MPWPQVFPIKLWDAVPFDKWIKITNIEDTTSFANVLDSLQITQEGVGDETMFWQEIDGTIFSNVEDSIKFEVV